MAGAECECGWLLMAETEAEAADRLTVHRLSCAWARAARRRER
jgi:hypothetical protein